MAPAPQFRQIVLIGLACALAGIVVGRYVPGSADKTPPAREPAPSEKLLAREKPPPAAVQAPAQPLPARDPELEDQIATLQREKDQIQQQLTDFLQWLLVNYKGKYPLPESFMAKLRLSPVSGDLTLNREVAELLKITAEEEALINDAFVGTEQLLTEVQSALMTIREERPDRVVVHIPAFSEEGGLVKDDLLLALESTMGPERFDRFLEVGEKELDETFQKFGQRARTIIFEVVYPPEAHAAPLLRIKDGWIEDDGPGRKIVTATQSIVEELPDEYLAYINWLGSDGEANETR
jgi:hypothetical protein